MAEVDKSKPMTTTCHYEDLPIEIKAHAYEKIMSALWCSLKMKRSKRNAFIFNAVMHQLPKAAQDRWNKALERKVTRLMKAQAREATRQQTSEVQPL